MKLTGKHKQIVYTFRSILCRMFRYGGVSILLFTAFSLSFFMFNYFNVASKIDDRERQDRATYKYDIQKYYMMYGKGVSISDLKIAQDKYVNVVLQDIDFYVGEVEYPRTSEVVVLGTALAYPIISGEYPSEEELNGEIPCVVLGKSLKRFTYERRNRDYIKINKEEYVVTGYVSAENSTVLDHKVILYYSNIGERVKQDIDYYKNSAAIVINVSASEKNEKYNEIVSAYDGFDKANMMEIEYQDFEFSDALSDNSRKMAKMIFAFSLMIIVLCIIFWYLCNFKEFAIRKACGYTYLNLAIMILSRVLGFLIGSILISEIVMYITDYLNQDNYFKGLDYCFVRVAIIIRYLIVVVPVTLIYPLVRVYKEKPDSLIRKV